MNRVGSLLTVLLCLVATPTVRAVTAPATAPAKTAIAYPDYSSPRRAVETFIWAVEAHDSDKISACLYGRTKLEKSAAGAFARMTAAMGSMLATAKKRLGPPPGHQQGPSVTARLAALKAALVHSTVAIKGNRAVIGFPPGAGKEDGRPLHLIRRGTQWKLNIRYMLHLQQAGISHQIIKNRIADEKAFAHLLEAVTADLSSGKIKSWRQFTVDFESRMLAEAARREAKKEAARKLSK